MPNFCSNYIIVETLKCQGKNYKNVYEYIGATENIKPLHPLMYIQQYNNIIIFLLSVPSPPPTYRSQCPSAFIYFFILYY